LKSLDGGVWKTRIAEPKQPGLSRWHGDDKARNGGLCKPHPSGFGSRQASDAAAGGNRRAVVRPSILTEAGCGGPSCADAKMFTNDIWSTSPATTSAS
jgi:hypothetical protein